jgi:hypothetical protein
LEKLKELNSDCDYPYKSEILLYMDRKNLYNKKNCLVGLFKSENRFMNILDINAADSIRFEYNCLRIKEDAIKSGQSVPVNYIPKKYPYNFFCSKKYQLD